MNVIGTEGNNVRQIVPAEFNFLSAADRQVVAALQGVVRMMYGLESGQAVVVEGMGATWENTTAGIDASFRLTKRLTLAPGVVMWNGGLWEFGGATIEGLGRLQSLNGDAWVLVMSEQVAPPSPVYGATIALDVSPHKRLVCTLASAEDAAEETQKVTLGNVMRIRTGGVSVPVSSTGLEWTRIEETT
jgi:hypothetical protein